MQLSNSCKVMLKTAFRVVATLVCFAWSMNAQDLGSKLIEASRMGNAAEIRQLLNVGADPNFKAKSGRTALMEAASGGYTGSVRILLSKGATVNDRDWAGWSALFRAVFSGRADTVHLLLQKGANVKAKDKDGKTALFWASSSGYTTIVRLLLSRGSNVNAQDDHGWTPLMSAANLGHVDTVRALLKKRAALDVRDRDGNTAETLAKKYQYYDVVAALKSAALEVPSEGKNVRRGVPASPTSATVAPSTKPVTKPSAEISAGDLASSTDSTSPASTIDSINRRLLDAAEAGDSVEILSLIREGAGVNAKDPVYGTTALIRAAGRGYTDTVGALLDKGGDVDAVDKAGRTALMQAAFGGYTKTVLLLIEKGANVNAQDHDGWTPLFWAAFSRRADTVRTLLDKGANVDAKNKQQDTALIRAAYGGDLDTLAVLLEHHPDLNAKDDMGRTALIEAAREERVEALRLLLQSGADLDQRDRNDDTALSVATRQHATRIIAELKQPVTNTDHAAGGPPAVPSPQPQLPHDDRSEALAAEEQTLHRKAEVRAFYRLGLSIRLLENFSPEERRRSEEAAAQILSDIREVSGPAKLIDLAQQTFTRLAYPPSDNNGPVKPPIAELHKNLDEYCSDQTDKTFFYSAGGFTYELNIFAQNVAKTNTSNYNTDEMRSSLLPRAVGFAAKCEVLDDCRDRAHKSFLDSANILRKSALLADDGQMLRKLSTEISVALGNADR